MSGFAILGFDKDTTFRFTAMLEALNEFGRHSARVGVINSPLVIGEKIVCVRCEDFGAVFKTKEIYRLAKTVKRVPAFPKFANQFMDQLTRAADDAVYATETGQKRMI